MPTQTEAIVEDIRPEIDPRLAGMAAVYGCEISIDEAAIRQALPHLRLPGTAVEPLEFKAELHRDSTFNDVYWSQRVGYEDKTVGTRLTMYYSQKDVKNHRDHQAVTLRALKEAVNLRNPELRKEVRRYESRRGTQAITNALLSIIVPAAGAYLGIHELAELAKISEEGAQVIGGVACAGTGLVSFAGTLRYGVPLSQKANLRRSPYQKYGQPIPEDLPPIVQFKPIDESSRDTR